MALSSRFTCGSLVRFGKSLSLFYLQFTLNPPLKYCLIHRPFSPMFAAAQPQQTNGKAMAATLESRL